MKKLATVLILCWPSYPAQLSVPATVRKTKGRLERPVMAGWWDGKWTFVRFVRWPLGFKYC
jgi:hypothetical protein